MDMSLNIKNQNEINIINNENRKMQRTNETIFIDVYSKRNLKTTLIIVISVMLLIV